MVVRRRAGGKGRIGTRHNAGKNWKRCQAPVPEREASSYILLVLADDQDICSASPVFIARARLTPARNLTECLLKSGHRHEQLSWVIKKWNELVMEIKISSGVVYGLCHNSGRSHFDCVLPAAM
jgi:hypothetical protein